MPMATIARDVEGHVETLSQTHITYIFSVIRELLQPPRITFTTPPSHLSLPSPRRGFYLISRRSHPARSYAGRKFRAVLVARELARFDFVGGKRTKKTGARHADGGNAARVGRGYPRSDVPEHVEDPARELPPGRIMRKAFVHCLSFPRHCAFQLHTAWILARSRSRHPPARSSCSGTFFSFAGFLFSFFSFIIPFFFRVLATCYGTTRIPLLSVNT